MSRKDFDFSFLPHPMTGDLATKSGSSAIKQSLKNIVLTNFYERGFNVDVAGNITYQLFENIDQLMVVSIKEDITRAIKNFEPDVEVVDVLVDEDGGNAVLVDIIYNELNNPNDMNVRIKFNRIR